MYTDYSRKDQVEKTPDYGFWLKREHWKLPEAAKLICGRDPMARFTGKPKFNTKWRVIDIIDRAFDAVQAGQLRGDRSALLPVHVMVAPEDFLGWAKEFGLEIPGELQSDPTPEQSPEVQTRVYATAGPKINAHLVQVVARTLKIALPNLTNREIADHEAMKKVAGIAPDDCLAILSQMKD